MHQRMQHSIDDLSRHLSTCGVVEIRAATTVIVHVEGRKQRTDVIEIQTHDELPELKVVAISRMPSRARSTMKSISASVIAVDKMSMP